MLILGFDLPILLHHGGLVGLYFHYDLLCGHVYTKAIFKMNNHFFVLSKQLGEICTAQNIHIALAESCTGGMLSSLITDVPGSSAWFLGGAVVYGNLAKKKLLRVDSDALEDYGAVSEVVALGMAKGAAAQFESDIALSITGIAGPHGGTEAKPVGTVCFALVDRRAGFAEARVQYFASGRDWIRRCAVEFALEWMIAHLR
jgi:nicotinamide-nucleotide amidase